MTRRPALVFDVNETLLDLEHLSPLFAEMFGEAAVMREWFNQLVLYSQSITLADAYQDFGSLAAQTLRMVATTRRVEVRSGAIDRLKDAIATMPPHPEVPAALGRLADAGFRMVTLTNNPRSTCERQLDRAGILRFFDRRFSVDDEIHRYKPALEAYRLVEQALGSPPSGLCLVACHTWDTLGAIRAGWDAAMILHPGNALLPVGAQPEVVGDDLQAVADKLVERHRAP